MALTVDIQTNNRYSTDDDDDWHMNDDLSSPNQEAYLRQCNVQIHQDVNLLVLLYAYSY